MVSTTQQRWFDYGFTEADASNLVVRQKDAILEMVNENRFAEARATVNVLAEMWARFDYAYKTREVIARIERAEMIYDLSQPNAYRD
jgi:hypothetical protein